MNLIDTIPVGGEALPEAVDQMKEAMKYEAVYGALMADHQKLLRLVAKELEQSNKKR